MKTYCEISLELPHIAYKEDLSTFCFKNGCLGISEDLPFEQKSLTYEPDVHEGRSKKMVAYFEAKPSEEFFIQLQQRFARVNVQINVQETKDWLHNWKTNFKPFVFANPYWIVPSWHEVPSMARRFFRIDPGMAFGTGTHETTQMAAEWVLEIFRTQKHPKQVIDVGTGTGVLALLSKDLGATEVLGLDIDPECVRVSDENAQLNHFTNVDFSTAPIAKVRDSFDLVIANIVSGVLLNLKNDLIRVLRPGGHIILTGILAEEEQEFQSKFFSGTNLQCNGVKNRGDWVSFYATLLA